MSIQDLSSEQIIKHFNMTSHPEGGAFVETYKSPLAVYANGFKAERSSSTGIFFLIDGNDFSAFHRIQSDEMWHFYLGGPLVIVEITPSGELIETVVGNDILNDEKLQYVVKAGHWFASYPKDHSKCSLVGCTVAPGFEFEDFELGTSKDMIQLYPTHEELITKLTRQ